jgi:hypothetical protein
MREVLANWFRERHTTAVRFIENTKPNNDPYADYIVAYEAVFEPNTLDKACIEIWVATDGPIAIGLETKNRMAERLGIKGGKHKIFAAGHEPSEVTERGLLALLTVVAEGRIAISATCLPILGLVGTKAVLVSDTDEFLSSHGYDTRWWLTVVDDFESDIFRHVLRFTPW